MESDFILLNGVYHNSVTAVSAISELLIRLENGKLFECLFEEMTEYRSIAGTAFELMKNFNFIPRRRNFADKASFYFCINVISGKLSEYCAAKILINGSTEGIYDIVSRINSCAGACEKSRKLAYRLIETEQKNICSLNRFIYK